MEANGRLVVDLHLAGRLDLERLALQRKQCDRDDQKIQVALLVREAVGVKLRTGTPRRAFFPAQARNQLWESSGGEGLLSRQGTYGSGSGTFESLKRSGVRVC